MNQPGANLISVDHPALMRTLLPRATGKFSRYGLKVNNLRYRNDDFTEQYLAGGTATVAYNPDDVSEVWLIEKEKYTPFMLVETRFRDASLSDVDSVRESQKTFVRMGRDANKQAQIDLIARIETIASNAANHGDTRIQDIRKTRKAEQTKSHFSILKGGDICDQRA